MNSPEKKKRFGANIGDKYNPAFDYLAPGKKHLKEIGFVEIPVFDNSKENEQVGRDK